MSELERDPRVYLAAERTMLAWIRTGLAMMGFGFVVARFGLFLREFALHTQEVSPSEPATFSMSLWLGTSLVIIGVWVNLAAAAMHLRFRSRFERGEPFVTPRGFLTLIVSLLLAILGIAMTLHLITVGWS